MNWDHNYNQNSTYSQSKLAQMMFAYELQDRLAAAKRKDFEVYVCHPGSSRTSLITTSGNLATRIAFRLMSLSPMVQSAEKGSWPEVMCATERGLEQRALHGPTERPEPPAERAGRRGATDLPTTPRSGDPCLAAHPVLAEAEGAGRPNAPAVRDLRRVFEGDDLAAIADRLGKLDAEIPLAAIDWDDEGEGGDLSGALERHAEQLDTPVLRTIYRVIATRVYGELYGFDGWDELHRVLGEREGHDFAALLSECWSQRYENLNPGHLGPLEETMLEHLGRLPGHAIAELVLEALKSHGPDALGDFLSMAIRKCGFLTGLRFPDEGARTRGLRGAIRRDLAFPLSGGADAHRTPRADAEASGRDARRVRVGHEVTSTARTPEAAQRARGLLLHRPRCASTRRLMRAPRRGKRWRVLRRADPKRPHMSPTARPHPARPR